MMWDVSWQLCVLVAQYYNKFEISVTHHCSLRSLWYNLCQFWIPFDILCHFLLCCNAKNGAAILCHFHVNAMHCVSLFEEWPLCFYLSGGCSVYLSTCSQHSESKRRDPKSRLHLLHLTGGVHCLKCRHQRAAPVINSYNKTSDRHLTKLFKVLWTNKIQAWQRCILLNYMCF